MVVITLTDCPPKVRGDLSKWLCEINPGVYVGNLNARVRQELYSHIFKHNNNYTFMTDFYTAVLFSIIVIMLWLFSIKSTIL